METKTKMEKEKDNESRQVTLRRVYVAPSTEVVRADGMPLMGASAGDDIAPGANDPLPPVVWSKGASVWDE